MQDFKTLRVWHVARKLSLAVIDALPERVGRKVPKLRNQAIRAATSVESNLAEGCGTSTRPEFLQFVQIALASLNEVQGQLSLARDTRILDKETHTELYDRINLTRRMLIALMRTLQRRIAEDESKRRKESEGSS
jgi:four helix bundle protein